MKGGLLIGARAAGRCVHLVDLQTCVYTSSRKGCHTQP